ncbi:MAG: hypothetical protein OHK0028_16910 [Deltaproteobacteria bacterium]
MTPRRALVLCAFLCAGIASSCAGVSGTGAPPEGTSREALPVRGLKGDETWSGEVRIRGSVVVPRGVTLTIAPGTVVRFEKIDVDADGIGDSELYVEGDLIAEGAPGRPIVFTSAEQSPSARDWKYLFVNLSRKTVLSRCVSEYAFSGAQIHFSRATVTRCLFRRNVDGFRFSTAVGVFSGNRMTENVYGVRYEERNSAAILSGNEITGNRVGIFCVMESTGNVTIRANRIFGNADYDFKLGNRQRADVPVPGNWWGTPDPDAIRKRIFDRGTEPELGRVLFEPPLSGPPREGEGYGP